MQRDTAQRRAIREAISRAGRPLSPGEIREQAAAVVASLGIATVYRAIQDLVTEGWLEPVELPGEPPRYERAGKRHHHHFRCRACERVFEVHGCPGGLRAVVPAGFELESHEVVLYGRCAGCVAP